MRVKTIQLTYEAGFYQNSNHNPKNNLRFEDAAWCRTNGNGYYWLGKSAKYILTAVKEGGGFIEINIRWMFGKSGIVLTKKRRELLESNLPKYFELEYDGKHDTYFISWEDFWEWIKVVE